MIERVFNDIDKEIQANVLNALTLTEFHGCLGNQGKNDGIAVYMPTQEHYMKEMVEIRSYSN